MVHRHHAWCTIVNWTRGVHVNLVLERAAFALGSNDVEALVVVKVCNLDINGRIAHRSHQRGAFREHPKAAIQIDAVARAQTSNHHVEVTVHVNIKEATVVVIDRRIGRNAAGDIGPRRARAVVPQEQLRA